MVTELRRFVQGEAKCIPQRVLELRSDGFHVLIGAADGTQFLPPILVEHAMTLEENGMEVVKMACWFGDQLIDLTMVPNVRLLYREVTG